MKWLLLVVVGVAVLGNVIAGGLAGKIVRPAPKTTTAPKTPDTTGAVPTAVNVGAPGGVYGLHWTPQGQLTHSATPSPGGDS